jgi:hypothetical protein
MASKKTLQLIQQELDGTSTPSEREKLRAILENDEEARELLVEFRSLSRRISSLDTLDPSPVLRSSVLRSIAAAQTRSLNQPVVEPWYKKFFDPVPSFRTALVFAGGVAAGILVLFLFSPGIHAPENADLVGSLMLNETPATHPVVAEWRVEMQGVQGTVKAEERKDLGILRLDLETTSEITATILAPSGKTSVRAARLGEGTTAHVAFSPQGIQVTGKGKTSCVIIFEHIAHETPLSLAIKSGDGGVWEKQWAPGDTSTAQRP